MSALSLSQILPGATGVTLMRYIGRKLDGGRGGTLMPFAFALPAMTAITVLSWAYFSFGDLHFVHMGWNKDILWLILGTIGVSVLAF